MLLFIMDVIMLLLENRDNCKNSKSKMLPFEFLYLDSTTNTHKNWTKKQSEKVLGMNESPFKIFGECGKTYVYTCPGEEFNAECLTPIAKQGGRKNPGLGVFDFHKCRSYPPHRMVCFWVFFCMRISMSKF